MTLTEATFWTKRFGIILLVLTALFTIAVFLFTRDSSPPPFEYQTATYNCSETKEEFIAEKLEIPSLKVNSDSENTFLLQTDSGKVKDLSELKIINVHKYKIKSQQLDNQIKAKSLASTLGFDPDKIYRKGTTDYIWTNSTNSRSLDINAKTLNFVMTTNSSYIRDVAKETNLPTENEAISTAVNTIRRLNILGSDFNYNDTGNITTHLIDINPDGSYSQAPSLAEAELIKVDFHKTRSMISIKDSLTNSDAIVRNFNEKLGEATEDEIIVNNERVKIFNYSTLVTYNNPNSSHISIYVGADDPNSKQLESIYGINFTYWQLETESCGTYELIDPSIAIERVQAGEGSLVYLNEKGGDEIEDYQPKSVKNYIIYDIALTYYEPLTQVNFLQPIYVVSGETTFKDESRGEFHIFYPAIDYDIIIDKVEVETPEITTD
ncbi:hypothetical protein K8R14_04645 [bacterium]|nr:hypothetical protein [bacterium]